MDNVVAKKEKGNDYLNLRRLYGKGLVRVVYTLGIIFILLKSISVFKENHNFIDALSMWIVIVIIANIIWRLICEILVALFDIREALQK